MTTTYVPGLLPELPLSEWAETKETLHRYVQIVGKIRLATTPRQNHWWNVPLYVSPRGLTTHGLVWWERHFDIEFDLLAHRVVIRDDRGGVEEFALLDGLSVARFYATMMAALRRLDLDVAIRPVPYGISDATPFPEDQRHASYQADAVSRYWHVLAWVDSVLHEFAGWFCGKSSPVHLFWHSFDLALTRFSGRPAPPRPGADPVSAEAYSHEVISFGFWPGDANVPAPAVYSYTVPEPAGLTDRPLAPKAAFWRSGSTGSLAMVWYDDVRAAASPRATLLAFLDSAYQAGAAAAGWDTAALTTGWCPPPEQVTTPR